MGIKRTSKRIMISVIGVCFGLVIVFLLVRQHQAERYMLGRMILMEYRHTFPDRVPTRDDLVKLVRTPESRLGAVDREDVTRMILQSNFEVHNTEDGEVTVLLDLPGSLKPSLCKLRLNARQE